MQSREMLTRLEDNIAKVIVGKKEIVRMLLSALLSGGHVLLEDVPGTGKTTLAKCLAASLGCDFKRIQFTPDLLPADVCGLNLYDQKEQEFRFVPGPVITNILLADEINRATPRTQSALLEAMQEMQVTVDGKTYELKAPFMVIATQNPVETAGTYPLPEAQLDRFMMQLSMGLPDRDEEIALLKRFEKEEALTGLEPVLSGADVLAMREEVKEVFVHEDLLGYIVSIVNETRSDGRVRLPLSPRATLSFLHALKAYAYVDGRDHVLPDDVKKLAVPVLAHRMLSYHRDSENADVIRDALGKITVPSEDFTRR
ncbi:MAG: MoxR family ATPase [Lachnospiraceae bacterium]|nr:MoxR family ATPase [Lachnospiraceae bacterium]